jgi:hypothetical protein
MALLPSITSTALLPMVTVLPPSITNATSSLSINTPTITYNQLVNSLGTYNYGAIFFYISGQTFQQINQPVFYTRQDNAGNQISTYLPFTVDPYQFLPSLYYDKVNSDEIIFNGFSSLTFTSFANSIVYFKMFALIAYMGGFFERFKDDNFETVEKLEGISFFEDYCNYIIDEE